ncbi:hypothetical protein [Aestuariimicrobium sp. Y1814]|uniref:hypothetical protein n=1 Tax=Aestuariimicrobium sp. Y1814 TaxID=3418742 RepID=UPI003DA7078D
MQPAATHPRAGAWLLACLLALASFLLPAAPAVADPRTDCLREGNVWVVVQPVTSLTWTGCATEFPTGLAALASAGFRGEGDPFITRINGVPSSVDGQRYWAFWHATPTARGGFSGFTFAQSGPKAFRPEPGSVLAWTQATLGSSPSDAMPTVTLPGERRPSLLGDQDGNGQADLLALSDAGTLLLYPVRGARLCQPHATGQGWLAHTWVSMVPDIDGDLISELVARRNDGTLWLYRGLAGGEFGAPRLIGRGFGEVELLTVMPDITGDALPDLLARSRTGDLLRYSFPTDSMDPAGGLLTGAAVIGSGWQGIRLAASVGDASGDQVPDLLAVTQDGALLRYSIENGSIVAVHQIGRNWQSMTLLSSPGDLTRDARRDLVALRNDGTLWLYPHRGNGAFGPASQLSVGLTNLVALA